MNVLLSIKPKYAKAITEGKNRLNSENPYLKTILSEECIYMLQSR